MRKIQAPSVGFIENNAYIYVRVDNLRDVIQHMEDAVGSDPGLSALKKFLLEFELNAMRDVAHNRKP